MKRVMLTALLLLTGVALWAQSTLKDGMEMLEQKYVPFAERTGGYSSWDFSGRKPGATVCRKGYPI